MIQNTNLVQPFFFDYLLVYENKVYLDNGVYKIVSKQITDYFDENLYED